MNRIVIAIFALIWSVLFVIGLLAYSESKVLYLAFSIIFLLLLISAIYKIISYSFLFLVIFLWLGIWLKFTIHLMLNYDYIEPIGSFYTLNTSMDDVLIVAIVGAFAVLLINIFYRLFEFKSTIGLYEDAGKSPIFFNWYQQYKLYIFTAILIIALITGVYNVIFGIQLTGIVPKTILPYPLNALISWMIGIGFTLLMATLISWDVRFKKELSMKSLIFYVLISALTSIFILSRGQYIFMVGSLIVFLLLHYQKYKNINLLKVVLFVLFSGFIYIYVIYSVTILRVYSYPGEAISEKIISEKIISGEAISEKIISEDEVYEKGISRAYNTFLNLLIDRWIGVEGLMAVVSYPKKSIELFFGGSTIHTHRGANIDIYQYISNAHYTGMDQTKYAFSTMPGVMAYLYYSGSLWFVFIGMLLLSATMIFIEYIVYIWLKCSLLVAIIGVYLANSVANLGLIPINLLKSLFLIFSFFAFIKFIESIYLENLYLKFKKGFK